MIRYPIRSLMLLLILSLTWNSQAQTLPVIVSFTVDTAALDYNAVEHGVATANFSWQVVGLREGDTMQMHALVKGAWVLIGEKFEPIKTDSLVIAHPSDFGQPTYRLSVVDATGAIVTESQLVLQYAPQTQQPFVYFFKTWDITSLTPDEVKVGTLVNVHWGITNRWQNSNPVFEQVMPDGNVVKVELPRANEWLNSTSRGTVLPQYPGDGYDVLLRLRLVNRTDGSTLAQRDLIIPVIDPNAPKPEVISFHVEPQIGQRGGKATISWSVANANRVIITMTATGVSGCKFGLIPDEIYRDLPTSGTFEITLPEIAYDRIMFQLFPDRYIISEWGCTPLGVAKEIYLELESYTPR